MAEQNTAPLKVPSFAAEGVYQKFSDVFEPLLEEVGIPRTALTDPDSEISLAKHCKLMELAAERSGDDCFGLHMGSRVHPHDMGALGYAIMNSPTLHEALQNFARYLHVYARGCDMALETENRIARFTYSYSIVEPSAVERRQEAECTLALVKSVVDTVLDMDWHPNEVRFEHPQPDKDTEHRRIFGAPVYFGQPINCLVFDKRLLEHKVIHAESRLYTVLQEHLRQALASQAEEDDLVAKVGNLIAKSLSNGIPSADDVASQLCMTKRTLQRRLSDRGVLYNQYADKIRRQMACQYVEKTKLPLTEIAFLLGYAHVSAFSRAFRRWTGETPIECRARNPATR